MLFGDNDHRKAIPAALRAAADRIAAGLRGA